MRKHRVPRLDTWTMLMLPAPGRDGNRAIFATAAGLAWAYLTAVPRRLGDRLFAMNDTEAYWRGWQIIKLRGGLTRQYRDPAFDLAGSIAQSTRSSGLDCAIGTLGVALADAQDARDDDQDAQDDAIEASPAGGGGLPDRPGG